MILLLLIAVPIFTALIEFVFGRNHSRYTRIATAAILFGNMLLSCLTWQQGRMSNMEDVWMLNFQSPWMSNFGASFHLGFDGLSFVLILLIHALAIFAILFMDRERKENEGLFYGLTLLTVGGVVGVLLSIDLLLFFVFWELMLIPLYFLILIYGNEGRRFASTQFLIYTQVSGLLLLLAIFSLAYFHYSTSGIWTFDYDALIDTAVPGEYGIWVALGFLIAFLVKMPIVPFHAWMPSIFVDSKVAPLMTGIMVKTGVYAMLRIFLPLFPNTAAAITPYMMVLGLVTIAYGSILAFSQTHLKRILAYSTIGHMGLILLGLFSFSPQALNGIVILLVTQAIATSGLLLMCQYIEAQGLSLEIDHLGGLYRDLPKLGVLAIFFAMASVGLPGLGNFVGEWLTLLGIFDASPVTCCLALLGSVLSAVYLLRLLQLTFWGTRRSALSLIDCNKRHVLVMSMMVGLLLWTGLYPAPILDVVAPAWEVDSKDEQ